MGGLIRSRPLLVAALSAGFVAVASAPSAGGAGSPPDLRGQTKSLRSTEAAAVLDLYAAESSLGRAQAELAVLDRRSEQLAVAERLTRKRTEIVRRSLLESRKRVAQLLRALYIEGEPDPIAVILGATSLDEAIAGIEGLSRATAQNERLGAEALRRAAQLDRLRQGLASRRTELEGARSFAAAGARHLAAAVARRSETLASVRTRLSLTTERLSALEATARAAERRSGAIGAPAAAAQPTAAATATASATAPETTAAAAPAAPAGTRTLVVDAVAYHLPGNTASGLPVGVGVIAVDPTVIPLGTRVFVPGYGPAVAADVGTAIKGNIVDLWMPTTAQALAWGRRTVTITVYG